MAKNAIFNINYLLRLRNGNQCSGTFNVVARDATRAKREALVEIPTLVAYYHPADHDSFLVEALWCHFVAWEKPKE